jgi:hypothetical protein
MPHSFDIGRARSLCAATKRADHCVAPSLAQQRPANMELAALALMGSLTLMVLQIVDERRRDKLPR